MNSTHYRVYFYILLSNNIKTTERYFYITINIAFSLNNFTKYI